MIGFQVVVEAESPARGVRNLVCATYRKVARSGWISPVPAAATLVLLAMIIAAVFANQLAPYDPLKGDYSAIRQAPSMAHLLGTDDLGRDVLSRLIHGSRISLLVGFGAVALGDSLGLLLGLTSAYVGGRFDLLSQRALDVLLAFPGLILATLLMVGLGPGILTIIIAIGITRMPASTRVIRAVALTIKEQAYVDAARVVGASTLRIIIKHVAPQCIAPFMVVATIHLGIAITTEAALSFIGVGVPPPAPSWGTMMGGIISSSFKPPWWLAIFPGLAITLTVLSANLVGDNVRDLLDPKLRGRIN
jgi:peptide/nickel transport system permease protein